MKDDIVIVKFVERDGPYNAGETAGFSRATAQRLILRGVAAQVLAADAPAGVKIAPTPAPPVKEVTRTGEPPFVETDEGEDGEIAVKDARPERDKMTRAPQRRK